MYKIINLEEINHKYCRELGNKVIEKTSEYIKLKNVLKAIDKNIFFLIRDSYDAKITDQIKLEVKKI